MKKIISLVFMFISCIGIYAQQIMDATAAYKKANDLLERLTIEEKALMVRGYNKFFIKGFEEKGILPIYLSDATQGVNIRNNLPVREYIGLLYLKPDKKNFLNQFYHLWSLHQSLYQ